MSDDNPWSVEAIHAVETARRLRINLYRRRAANLPATAANEPEPCLRKTVLDLASEYEVLAEKLEQRVVDHDRREAKADLIRARCAAWR